MRLFGFNISRANKVSATNKSYPEQIFGTNDSWSGQYVDPDAAMRISTVFTCVKVLSETLGSAQSVLKEELEDGSKVDAYDQELYSLLRYEPNGQQSPMEFKEMMQANCVLNGNAYALIDFRGAKMNALVVKDPTRMHVHVLPNGDPLYEYYDNQGKKEYYKKDQIFHIRGLAMKGLVGMSLVEQLAELLGYSQAMTKHANKFFSNAARVGGVLQYPGKLTKQAIENLRTSWERQYGGVENAHKTAILEQGMTYQNIAMTFEDAQALGQMELTQAQIAGAMRTPLHLIGDYSKATLNNIEHLSLEFILYTMTPWAVRWSEACARCLMTSEEQRKYTVDFDFEPFLRGDSLATANTLSIGRQNGAVNADEWRKKIGLNPIANGKGKDYWQPLNMGKLGEVVQAEKPTDKGPGTSPGAQPAGAQNQNKPGISTKSVFDSLSAVLAHELRRVIKREEKENESAKKKGITRIPDSNYIKDNLRPIVREFKIVGASDWDCESIVEDFSRDFSEPRSEQERIERCVSIIEKGMRHE